MNIQQTFKIGASALVLTASLGLFPEMARATCVSLVGGLIEICPENNSPDRPQDQRPNMYVVREFNPFTGGVEDTYTFNDYDEAVHTYNQLKRVHWAEWQYAGIGEQMHRRRFSTSSKAQSFLASNPCPNPIFCVIQHKKVVAADVSMDQR